MNGSAPTPSHALPSISVRTEAERRLPPTAHTSVQSLEHDVREWIKNWNNDPQPFTWTKTADEILNSLAKYLARINGA
jgi:hypothetical protein